MPALTESGQGWLLNEAAFTLRALGRLTEALEPMRVGLEIQVNQETWTQASQAASNLSELELTMGEVAGAVGNAEQSVTYADRSGDEAWPSLGRTTHADALHQAGRRAESEARFREAEKMQAERQPAYPLLYSKPGFIYCDLLLASGTFRLPTTDFSHIDAAVSGLRRTSSQVHIPRGLLTRAWLRSLTGAHTGPESAQSDLDEAWEIAERGSMRLHMADIHLHRARLFGMRSVDGGMRNEEADGGVRNEAAEPYPWESPQADLEAAEKLIIDCGYHRRDEELADAKKAIIGQELP